MSFLNGPCSCVIWGGGYMSYEEEEIIVDELPERPLFMCEVLSV